MNIVITGILGIDSSRDRICAYPVNPVHPVPE